MTDGMMINEMMRDPLLSDYSIIMVDDIHERTLASAMSLGLLKKIRKKRPDLKIIISSAILEAEKFLAFMQEEKFPAKILSIEGGAYPVDIYYLKSPCHNYVVKALALVKSIHKSKPKGDILVFLTGQREIELFCKILRESKNSNSILALPLYSGLPIEAQMKVFRRAGPGCRKVIVSTNIAESSVTIDGIVYVIDSCFVKIKMYDYERKIESLKVVPLSKASCKQRSGRAGRIRSNYQF